MPTKLIVRNIVSIYYSRDSRENISETGTGANDALR